jgi:hypothetical protein
MESINLAQDPNTVVDPFMKAKLAFLYIPIAVPVLWALSKLVPKMLAYFH